MNYAPAPRSIAHSHERSAAWLLVVIALDALRALAAWRAVLLLLAALLGAELALAAVSVRGYFRSNGTYVAPHMRSSPDGNPYNNWSFPGNTNPYTGKVATGDPETYLRRYYERSGIRALPAPVLTPGANSPVELPPIPDERLPDYVAQDDLERSQRYCTRIFGPGSTSCEANQYRTLTSIVLPDYSRLPQEDVQRSARYCEWIYSDNRAGFYSCVNVQIMGLSRPPANFDGADQSDVRRSLSYCEWIFGNNRAGYEDCARSQARGLSAPKPDADGIDSTQWARATKYCEWIFGNNRSAAQSCLQTQSNSLRRYASLDTSGLDSREWARSDRYCEWIFGDNRGAAMQCKQSQANALRSSAGREVSPAAAQYCERIFGDNRSGYWGCTASRR